MEATLSFGNNFAAVGSSTTGSRYKERSNGDWSTSWGICSDMAFSNSLSYALESSMKLWQVREW